MLCRVVAREWATMAASSSTPYSSADLRLQRKWTPQKNRPGTTVLAPLLVMGKPMAPKAGKWIQRVQSGRKPEVKIITLNPARSSLSGGSAWKGGGSGSWGAVNAFGGQLFGEQLPNVAVAGVTEGDRLGQISCEVRAVSRHASQRPSSGTPITCKVR